MSKINHALFHRFIRGEGGQVLLPWVAVLMTSFFGIAGLTLDIGRAYVAHSQLQNAANAAALAAAGEVYNTSSTNDAYAYASQYSGSSGENNVSGVGSVTTRVYEGCVNSLMPAGSSCTSSSPKNAVQVVQSTTVRTFLMPIFFGSNTLNVSASATASMQGAAKPWNVAVVIDSTGSMSGAPAAGSCTGFSTEYSCALNGVKTLLENVTPCSSGSSCTTATAQFRVALFSFPNVTTGTAADYYNCSSTKPTNKPYTFPVPGQTSYTALTYSSATSTYEATPVNTGDGDVNGFVSDYWSGSSSNHLSSSSDLAKEVGGVSGCSSMTNPGGEGTYYAGIIYAAQSALTAEYNLYGGQNALIILSDGDATASSSSGQLSSGAATPAADGYTLNANGTTSYPSYTNQCQQAITAAQYAQSHSTKVYAVSFNSSSTTGCGVSGTDTSITATATSGQPTLTLSSLTPCVVMKNMASPASGGVNYFYADTSSSGCTDGAHTVNDVQSIFSAIASNFTTPRMLPNAGFLYGSQVTS